MTRESILVHTLVELADNLVEDFDVVDLLTTLCSRCVDTLDVTSAGVMLASPSGELQVLASSSDTMRLLELFELQADEGPCVDSFREGRAIINLDLSMVAARWPRFGPRAIADGFVSVHCLPMRLRGRTIGVLNMFRTADGSLDEADVVAAQALADIATIAILQHQDAVDAQILNNQLTEALNSRIIIEQAKGRISEAAHIDMDQAFKRLRTHARSHNLRLTDLCRSVVDGRVAPGAIDPMPPKYPS